MDKEIVENYGWIVIILILGLTVTLMSSPLGNYLYANMKLDVVEAAVEDQGLFDKNKNDNLSDDSVKVNINYEENGGTWKGGHIDFFIEGKNTVLPTNIVKENYQFAGWYLNSALTEQIVSIDGGQGFVSNGVTLYAKWIGEEYTISYNLAGGTFKENANPKFHYNFGTTIQTPPTPIRSGYKFVQWDIETSTSGSLKREKFSHTTKYSGPATFHAVWEKDV